MGLQVKHFVADYLLQFPWMIAGKGSFIRVGGYVHAAFHVAGTVLVLLAMSVAAKTILLVALLEFVIHYLLDYAKAHYSANIVSTRNPRLFWALNGLDQFLHHVTYIGIVFLVIGAMAI